LNENDTPELAMRIRISALPKLDDIDELDLRRRFIVGQIYELPVQLAATLIIAGYAEPYRPAVQAQAADRAKPAFRPSDRRR
jgi:hypothetical protein